MARFQLAASSLPLMPNSSVEAFAAYWWESVAGHGVVIFCVVNLQYGPSAWPEIRKASSPALGCQLAKLDEHAFVSGRLTFCGLRGFRLPELLFASQVCFFVIAMAKGLPAEPHGLFLGQAFISGNSGCCVERLIVISSYGGLEASNAFADSFAEFGQLFGSKDEQGETENNHQMHRLKQSFKHESSFGSSENKCGSLTF
jgi:hypothetical protein